MTFDEYQKKPSQPHQQPATILKIYSIGRWVLMVKRVRLPKNLKKSSAIKKATVSEADKQELAKETGDVLWYLAVFADHLGIPFEEIAQTNLDKLQSRKARGVIRWLWRQPLVKISSEPVVERTTTTTCHTDNHIAGI